MLDALVSAVGRPPKTMPTAPSQDTWRCGVAYSCRSQHAACREPDDIIPKVTRIRVCEPCPTAGQLDCIIRMSRLLAPNRPLAAPATA
jgi:hypothetical protein